MAQDLTIKQGKTFTLVIRAETEPVIRKPITGISFDAGAPRITAVGHGAKNGWRGYVTRVKGPTQINAENNPAKPSDFKPMTFIDVDTVEFNSITPVDEQGKQWPDYVSGGFLEFYTPIDLTGKTARMQIRAKAKRDSTLLASSEAADTPLNVLSLTVNNTEKTVTLVIDEAAFSAAEWKTGYYEIELVGTDVIKLASGKVTLSDELTIP